jgi:6-phosphogluconolactonase (cycloisomerase 2 family)
VDWIVLAPALIATVITMGVIATAAPDSSVSSRLVSYQQLPENWDMCVWDDFGGTDPDQMAALQQDDLFAALEASSAEESSSPVSLVAALEPLPGALAKPEPSALLAALAQDEGDEGPRQGNSQFGLKWDMDRLEREAIEARARGARAPLRTLRDTAPTYSAIAVDVNSNEVILQDNNLWSYRVFDRLSATPAGDHEITKPKRVVSGPDTWIQFNNGLYVDPVSGDIFSVESDVGDKMVRFAREANGNADPKAVLHTPHRAYNIAADESKQELYISVEFPSQVAVYRKDASGEEKPLRALKGDNTGLDGVHGIAIDEKNRLMFVNTWGSHSNSQVAGSGKYYPPAIKVYPLDADGDVKPVRVITGEKTLLNWPAAMKFNPDNGDLYVANDIGQSVLVFANVTDASVQGNVAPARVIKGPATRLRYPTGIAIDRKNQELWVSNLGNSSATVYPLMANGDVTPLRVIRSAEESKRSVVFGRTSAVSYDPLRQEILVPNCVNHPQIAAFPRSAKEDTPYLRAIEGQKSLLSRTMHDLAFDAIHDEIVVTGPLAQAILSFRGAASGEEAPLRVIQGDKTQIRGPDATAKLAIDPVHNEIFLATADDTIIVFDRLANGNVPPKRVLGGAKTMMSRLGNRPVRIDPIHNLLLVPSGGGGGLRGGGRMLVFDRIATGDTPPKAIIKGPVVMGNQFEVYAPKARLVAYNRDQKTIEIWQIPESGESAKPPIKIDAPLGRYAGSSGIVLDPLHKEVIIATAAGNSILTFSVPEVFE